MRVAASRAMTSATDGECDATPCFLQIQVIGTNVFGPVKHKYAPVVDFESSVSPAKLAPTYKANAQSSGLSPTQQCSTLSFCMVLIRY